MNPLIRGLVMAINEGVYDDSFDNIYAALKARQTVLQIQRAAQMMRGSRVRFVNDDKFEGIEGVVTEKLAKNIKVRIDLSNRTNEPTAGTFIRAGRRLVYHDSVWTVTPNLLEVVE